MSASAKPSAVPFRVKLRQNLDQGFSVEELTSLCFDLGVDPQDIPGREQGKDYWIEQIILYCERRNLVADLRDRAAQARPALDWPPYTPALASDETPPAPVAPGAGIPVGPIRVPTTYLYVGLAVLVTLVVSVWLLRARANSAPPPVTTTPATATTAATSVSQPSSFDVAIVSFGQLNEAGEPRPSPDGDRIAQELARTLQLEFDNLPVDVKQHFNPRVRLVNQKLVADDVGAQQLALELDADAVVYGNLTPGQTVSSLEPRFYVAKLRPEAEELVGSHGLGKPIALRLPLTGDNLQALQFPLTYRQKLLAGFALGLMYDLFGRHTEAQKVLTRTWDDVQDDPEQQGRDVLAYFIGRQFLFLKDGKNAAEWYQKALAANPQYARAYIGLAGIDCQKAALQQPLDRLSSPQSLDQCLANYSQALDMATAARESQVVAKANLGLGFAHRLHAEALMHQHNFADADKEFAQASSLIKGTLPELSGQYRLLANGFSTLGATYQGAAASRQAQNDGAAARDLYRAAQDAYLRCMDQEAANPNDADVHDITKQVCQPGYQNVSQALKSLE